MPTRPTTSSTETWICNGTLLTQDGQRRVLDADLRLRDGRIAEILPRSKLGRARRNPPRSAQKIDARGLTVMPGFVQTHVHLCQTLFRNQADDLELLDWLSKRIWVFEAAHTAESMYASALLGIHELLSSGTTCILDMGTLRHTEAIFEAVRKSGIRANVGKCLMDHPKTTPKSLREPTEVALREAAALHDLWNGRENDRIRASFAPRFAVSSTRELLEGMAEVSRERGAIIHTHASENRKECAVVRKLHGKDNVEVLHQLGLTSPRLVVAHAVWLSRREISLLARSGSHVTHCPRSNFKLASGISPVPELLRQGVRVSLGSDGAPCNNNLDAFGEMRMAALVHKPGHGPRTLPAGDILDMATREGAKALHWWDDIGSIELGKKADLIALDLERPENARLSGKRDFRELASVIVYSTDSRHVSWTMVDGQLVYRSGRVLTIPEEPLMRQARAARAKLPS